MGGTIGAPWKALLRREFAALRDGERAEIELAVAQHVKQSNFKKRVNERAWTKEEKQVSSTTFRRDDELTLPMCLVRRRILAAMVIQQHPSTPQQG